MRDASANRRFAFFPRLDVRRENERSKRKIGEGNGKRRRLDRRRDDDSASARRAGNRRAVVKRSPDVGAERFIVNLRKMVQLFLQKCRKFALTAFYEPSEPRPATGAILFLYLFRQAGPGERSFFDAFRRF